MSSRRLARKAAVDPVLPLSEDPNRIVQRMFTHPTRGPVRAWIRGGAIYRIAVDGRRIRREHHPAEFDQIMAELRP